MITFENASVQGDNYTTDCLLGYLYYKEYYKLIVIDFSKQQALYADSKGIQQINFTGYLEENTTIFFIAKEAKELF